MEIVEDDCRLCGARLYLDEQTDPSRPLWPDADGECATCGDRDPHVPDNRLR